MSVHYKFKSSKDYDTLTFDGLHISVEDLKKAILQQKKMKVMADFDLEITNAQTKEVYTDNSALIPKNSSVVVVRIPVTGQTKKYWDRHDNSGSMSLDKDKCGPSFGNGKLSRTADLVNANASESDKILAMMSQSSADYDPSKYVKSSSMNGPLPPNYLCYRCGRPGHWIKNCPTNSIDVKRSTGIPRSFMVTVDGPDHKGAYLTSNGQFAVPAIDHAAYRDVKKDSASKREIIEQEKEEVPAELICSLCKNIFVDAVLIPCCGESFCDECIRQLLLDSENQECPVCHEENVSPDNLIPTRSVRTAVKNFLNKIAGGPKNSNTSKNSIPQMVASNSQLMKPDVLPVLSTPLLSTPSATDSVMNKSPNITESQSSETECKSVAAVPVMTVESAVKESVKSAAPNPEVAASSNASQKDISPNSPAEDESVSNVDDDRPGTPLADEVTVPIEPSVSSTAAVPNVSATLPPMSFIENDEPQPPGISDDVSASAAQAIATVTTRGAPPPFHYHHQTSGFSRPLRPSLQSRYKKQYLGRHPAPRSSRYSTPFTQSRNYTSTTNAPPPPPGLQPAAFSQAPSFPPPGQIPPAPSVLPPGTFPPGVPYNPAEYRTSNPFGLYGSNSSHPRFNFGNYDPVMQDPYHEFHRKMREKEARERYRYRHSRSRSRSRSSSTDSSHSYSRSRSRSYSRSPSPRSFSRSRSHSRTPPRYRRKPSSTSHSQRYESRYTYKKRRRSRSPLPEYRHSPPHHRPYRVPEYPSNYYGDSYYSGRVPSYPTRVSPNGDRVSNSRDYFDRNEKYEYRSHKMSYGHEPRDRQTYLGERDKNHHHSDELKSHHNSPGKTDKELDKRSVSSRNDSKSTQSHSPKNPTLKTEKTSKNVQSGGSPKIRPSLSSRMKSKGKSSSDEKREKSDCESLKRKKKKHRGKKQIDGELTDSKENDVPIKEPVSEEHIGEISSKNIEFTDKVKKHKHKKHRIKEDDPNKKKKRKKLKGSGISTTTDTEGDLKEEKQEDRNPVEMIQSKEIEHENSDGADESDKLLQPSTPELGNVQYSQSDFEISSTKNVEQDPDQEDVNNQSVNYVPELSKWERDEIDESPITTNLLNKKAQRESKQPLPSEIIQRAEKAILLKMPKPSVLTSVPSIVKSIDKKGSNSKGDHSNNPSKVDKHNRIVYDTESIKITIPNDEKMNTKCSRSDSRKRLDRSKLLDKCSEPHRQSSVIVVKENKFESRNYNIDMKDSARDSRYREHDRSDKGRQSHSPHYRERISRFEESSWDSRNYSKRIDDRQMSSSNKLCHKASSNRRSDTDSSSKSSHSLLNVKKIHKNRIDSAEKPSFAIDSHMKEDKSSLYFDLQTKIDQKESDRKKFTVNNDHFRNESRQNNKPNTESGRKSEIDNSNIETSESENFNENQTSKEHVKISEQTDGESDRSNNTNEGVTFKNLTKFSPSQTDSLIQDDESNFVPDYDGTSHFEESSDEESMGGNLSKNTDKVKKDVGDKTKSTSSNQNNRKEKFNKKRKDSEDSSDSSSSSEPTSLPKKRKHRHHDNYEEKKRPRKHKKDKKHKKHKKKKSKSKHHRSEKSRK